MSRISPLKYGTDGTENRPGDMDKGHWRGQPGSNGKQKRAAVLQLTIIQIIEKEVRSSRPEKTWRKDRLCFVTTS